MNYPANAATRDSVQSRLSNAIAGGAVTNFLSRAGFLGAQANNAIIFISSSAPTAAPTQWFASPGKLSALVVCGFFGVCALVGFSYYCLCRACGNRSYYDDEDPNFAAVQPEGYTGQHDYGYPDSMFVLEEDEPRTPAPVRPVYQNRV